MFNWNKFDKLFNEMFNSSFDGFSFDENKWQKRTYKSPDGSISMTYFTHSPKVSNQSNEIELLKQKLDLAVEEQNFEDAVKLRDEIKNLEINQEKILELKNKLDECVKNQDFERAIEYRDQIKNLK